MHDKQYRNIPFSPPDISEEEIVEVVNTLKSGWITTGPKTKEFERRIAEFVGVKRAVCLNSATAAMELTLRILGVGQGDEVITTAYTYTATASVIHHVGAKIVLVDTAKDSYEMDYKQLEAAITKKTKVIIPVDLAGIMCDYDTIFEIVEQKKALFKANNEMQANFNRVVVMADAAHAFGASRNGKKCGQVADFTTFSFHAVKNLTTAEGGAVVWNNKTELGDEKLYKEYMLFSLHGQSKDALAKTQKGAWEYDILYPAYKCNMTDIMASIGLVQLNRYEKMLNKRREIIYLYSEGLKNQKIGIPEHFSDSIKSSGHLFMIQLSDDKKVTRDVVIARMAEKGISCNVHYKPLPLLSAYKDLGFNIENFPNAYNLYINQLSLPLHSLLSTGDIDYIINTLIEIYRGNSNV